MRYWPSSWLVAKSRLARKSNAAIASPWGTEARIASASLRVKTNRGRRKLLLEIKPESTADLNIRSTAERREADSSGAISGVIGVFPGIFPRRALTLLSFLSKTGSARTATVLDG